MSRSVRKWKEIPSNVRACASWVVYVVLFVPTLFWEAIPIVNLVKVKCGRDAVLGTASSVLGLLQIMEATDGQSWCKTFPRTQSNK